MNFQPFSCGPGSNKSLEPWSRTREQLKHCLVNYECLAGVPGVGYVAVCPYCNIANPSDMHEGLIKKGDVQTWPEENRKLINHPINCVVICHCCHMEHGQTSYFTDWFVRWKLQMGWTAEQMMQWLEQLPFKILTDRTAYVRKYLTSPQQDLASGTI